MDKHIRFSSRSDNWVFHNNCYFSCHGRQCFPCEPALVALIGSKINAVSLQALP